MCYEIEAATRCLPHSCNVVNFKAFFIVFFVIEGPTIHTESCSHVAGDIRKQRKKCGQKV